MILPDENHQEIFDDLIARELYACAAIECYRSLNAGGDPRYWKMQLGFVGFLDERSENSGYLQYTVAIRIFEELVQLYPNDADIIFWRAYIAYILGVMDDDEHRQVTYRALQMNPQHPYANLSYASTMEYSNRLEEAIYYRKKCIEIQPFNHRALFGISGVYIKLNLIEEARTVLQILLEHDPIPETNYGIINRYINEVFIGTDELHIRERRRLASNLLQSLS